MNRILLLCAFAGLMGCEQTTSENITPDEVVTPAPELVTPTGELVDLDPRPNVVEVELRAAPTPVTMGEGEEQITLPMWTYNGQFPGPTLRAKVGDEVIVNFYNDLPQATTVHWHGLRISDQMDGNPRIQNPVEPGGTFTYRFVVPEAGTFWYHPHMRTNEQAERGLVGSLVVHETEPPAYDRERVVVLDDVLVSGNNFAPFMRGHGEAMHGRNGNVLLVNGRPGLRRFTAKQGEVERWRMINTTNARTFQLSLRGAQTWVIGTDGGLLGDAKAFPSERLELAVGGRFDVEVSYDEPGTFELVGHFLALDENDEVTTIEIPLAVVDVEATGTGPRSVRLPEVAEMPERSIDREVTMEFAGHNDPARGLVWTINGKDNWLDGPIFTFNEGETVKINLVNKVGPEHPFHLHGQWFEIVNDGRPMTRHPGLKDTVLLPGMERLSIIAYFDNPGQWMAHCHILEHAELGMMGEIVVLPKED